MTHPWDEFSKSLSEEVPRRESLRRLGVVLAGIVLGPLAARTARAGGKGKPVRAGARAATDPCKTFCKCRDKAQQNACLAACKACGGDIRRLCGACGSYYCADLAKDVHNCGACRYVCPQPGPYEHGACVSGRCTYACVEGAVLCDGACTSLASDRNNCGACGNVCPDSAHRCTEGVCDPCTFPYILCGGVCVDPTSDRNNCGGCGSHCGDTEACVGGFCESGGGF
jgi:hypothetical protein